MLGDITAQNRLMGIINDLDQDTFVDITTRLLKSMQFTIIDYKVTPRHLDFQATRDEEDSRDYYFIRAKRGARKVTPEELQDTVGKKKGGVEMKPVFISTAGFTEEADKYADMLNISLADDEKFSLLLKKFDLEEELESGARKRVVEQEGDRFLPSINELENLMQWGNDFFTSGNYPKAIEYYDRALQLKSGYDLAWMMKGNVMNAMARYEDAIECFKKALKINEENTEAWYNMGATLYNLERYEEEIQCYDQAIEIDPDFVKAWNNKGATLHQLGKYEEAVLCYDRVLKTESDNVNVLNNRGVALKHIGEFDDALVSFDKAIKKKEDYVDAWLNKGILLFEMEIYPDSVKCFDRVLAKWKSPEVLAQKGLALAKMEKYLQAVEAFEAALLMKPNWDLALEEKAKAEELMLEVEDQRAEKEADKVETLERDGWAPPTDTGGKEKELDEDFREIMEVEVVTPAEPLACPECGKPLSAEARFCSNCGTGVEEGEAELDIYTCSECDTEVAADATECPKCGTDLTDDDLLADIEAEDELDEPEILPAGEPAELEALEEEREIERALDHEAMLLERGRLLRGMERYDDALKSLDEALSVSDRPALWLEKANVLALKERYDDALDMYDKVLREDKNNLAALLNKETALLAILEFEKAIAFDDLIVKLAEDQPLVWARRGSLLRKLGRIQEAVECFERAIELCPHLAEVWNAQGAALLAIEKYDDAVLCLDRAIQIDPDFAEAWCNKGAATLASGDAKKSIQYFDRAIDIDDENKLAWSNKGTALYEMGRFEEAVECFDEALTISVDVPLLINKAWTLLSDDKMDIAVDVFDRVITRDQNSAEAWNGRGVAFTRMGELANAYDSFNRALTIAPDFEDAKSNLDAAKRRIEGVVEEPEEEEKPKKKGKKQAKKKKETAPELEEAIEAAEELEQEELAADEFKCPTCFAIGSIDDVYCEKCGQRFSEKMKEEAVEQELVDVLEPEVKDVAEKELDEEPDKKKPTKDEFIEELMGVPGVGYLKAEALWDAGCDTFGKLRHAEVEKLAKVKGISRGLAKKIKKKYK